MSTETVKDTPAPIADGRARSVEELEEERALMSAISETFLELPSADGLQKLQKSLEDQGLEPLDEREEPTTSDEAFGQFLAWAKERKPEEVWLHVARERACFVRGVGLNKAKPPYESLFSGSKQNEIIGSLNRFYADCGFKKSDEVRDTADQLGVQCAFAATLLDQELSQIADGKAKEARKTDAVLDDFMSQHLSRWASAYAQQVVDQAKTPYWKGIGLLIQEAVPGRAA